jgi:large subunit ribosomal protein L4
MNMKVPVLNMAGAKAQEVDLPAEIFEYKINIGLMHQYVVMQHANARLGTHKTLRRGEVNRTTQKWYRQKGTGRARHGARSAPIFVGGGRAHGPVPHKYTKDMPIPMRHAALKSALSAILRDGQLVVIEKFDIEQPKAKLALNAVKSLIGDKTALLLLPGRDEKIEKAVGNLEEVMYLHSMYINVRDLLRFDRVIMTLESLEVIKKLLGKKARVTE